MSSKSLGEYGGSGTAASKKTSGLYPLLAMIKRGQQTDIFLSPLRLGYLSKVET